MRQPLVTIVVTFYQAEKYLSRQVESLLALDYPNLALIIVDNASQDNTLALVEAQEASLKSKFESVKIVAQSENGGPSAGFNAGVPFVTGTYFVQTDGDDYLRATAITEMVAFAEEHQSDVVQGMTNYYDGETGALLSEHRVSAPINLLDTLLGVNTIFNPGTRLIRTAAFQKLYPDMTIYDSRQGQNWQVLVPFVIQGKFDIYPDVVLDVSRWPNSHSTMTRSFDDVMNRINEYRLIWQHAISTVGDTAMYQEQVAEAYTQHLFTTAYEYRQVPVIKQALKQMAKPAFKQRLKYMKALAGK